MKKILVGAVIVLAVASLAWSLFQSLKGEKSQDSTKVEVTATSTVEASVTK